MFAPSLHRLAAIEYADRPKRPESIPSYRAWRASQNQNAPRASARGRAAAWFTPTADPVRLDARTGRRLHEILMPGCFSESLASGKNILALIDHEPLLDVGGTADGSLRLTEDADGLNFTLRIPETRTGQVLQDAIERGLLRGMSFKYRPLGELGVVTTEGQWVVWRARLSEISFLIRHQPAYRSGWARMDVPIALLRERLDALAAL